MQGPGASESNQSAEPAWICFSAQDWWYFNRAHSDFQLMTRIARERRVLLVNSIGMRMPMPGKTTQVTRRIIRKARSVMRFLARPVADLPGFYVMTPVFLPVYGSPTIRRINATLVRAQLRFAARRAGISVDRAVMMVTIPTAWDVVSGLPKRALLANRSDLHSAFVEADQDLIRELEAELVSNSDVVLYTSRSLMQVEGTLAGDRAEFLDHGVDLDRFSATHHERPADIADIEGPIIGFFGGIEDYVVDLEVLEKVALAIPEATLVLVGHATCAIDRLVALPNVRWLGFRPYEQIPAYGAAFDVALLPRIRNAFNEYANPIKLKEYLALGVPIVSTEFPEVHHYDDVVAVASDDVQFVELVKRALAGHPVGTPESRRARVEGATWDRCASHLLRLGERRSAGPSGNGHPVL